MKQLLYQGVMFVLMFCLLLGVVAVGLIALPLAGGLLYANKKPLVLEKRKLEP